VQEEKSKSYSGTTDRKPSEIETPWVFREVEGKAGKLRAPQGKKKKLGVLTPQRKKENFNVGQILPWKELTYW